LYYTLSGIITPIGVMIPRREPILKTCDPILRTITESSFGYTFE